MAGDVQPSVAAPDDASVVDTIVIGDAVVVGNAAAGEQVAVTDRIIVVDAAVEIDPTRVVECPYCAQVLPVTAFVHVPHRARLMTAECACGRSITMADVTLVRRSHSAVAVG